MLAMKLFGHLFKEEERAAQPNIGEPVLSLVKAVFETDEWVVKDCMTEYRSPYLEYIVIENVKNKRLQVMFSWQVNVEFDSFKKYEKNHKCYADWMTDDEKAYMVSLLPRFRELKAKQEEVLRTKRNARQREEFMKELVVGHGQLALPI